MVLFQQSNVGEGKVASLAFALTLPLAVHIDLGHFYHVSDLANDEKRRYIRRYNTNTFFLHSKVIVVN